MKKLIFIGFLFLAGCNKDSTEALPVDLATIFNRAHLLFPAYDYEDEVTGDSIHVFGDGYVFTFFPPACLNGCPPEEFYEEFSKNFVIKWEHRGSDNVAMGIFKEEISLTSEPFINNPEDMVWTWHSGMDEGNIGEVKYKYGRGLLANGEIDYENDPPLLEFGKIYHLGIWVWNEEGTHIEYSTYPIRIKIVHP